MKLCTFQDRAGARVGVVIERDGATFVADITAAERALPRAVADLLAGGQAALEAARKAAERAPRLALEKVELLAPIPRPGRFLAIGLNYADHIKELGRQRPDFPEIFTKAPGAIVGPYTPVQRPWVSDSLDYEGELGVVIGRRCRHVPAEQADRVIAGYVVVNDFTVREWIAKTPLPTLGKSFDTCGPFGPWLVTADEVGDPGDLRIRTWVNGELRQNSRTSEMTFSCGKLVEILTTVMTLEPGDLITTGTPPGVGQGMKPPRYLKPGDRVRVEIERIGAIENPIIDEPRGSATGVEG